MSEDILYSYKEERLVDFSELVNLTANHELTSDVYEPVEGGCKVSVKYGHLEFIPRKDGRCIIPKDARFSIPKVVEITGDTILKSITSLVTRPDGSEVTLAASHTSVRELVNKKYAAEPYQSIRFYTVIKGELKEIWNTGVKKDESDRV